MVDRGFLLLPWQPYRAGGGEGRRQCKYYIYLGRIKEGEKRKKSACARYILVLEKEEGRRL